jgi:hypothetical protein
VKLMVQRLPARSGKLEPTTVNLPVQFSRYGFGFEKIYLSSSREKLKDYHKSAFTCVPLNTSLSSKKIRHFVFYKRNAILTSWTVEVGMVR